MTATPEKPEWSDSISNFLAIVRATWAPAPLMLAAVAQRTDAGYERRFGACGEMGEAPPEDQVFDLASISKSFFALLVSKLVLDGTLSFQTRLREVLPEVAGTHGGEQTIEALLSHRSGLVPHVELFRGNFEGEGVHVPTLLRFAASSVRTPLSFSPLYSDLGYILTGAAVTRITGRSLDDLLYEYVLCPFGIEAGSARAFRKTKKRFVPTEVQAPRGGVLVGVVHDDNAWALSGSGFCGHAGVFGTLNGVLTLGCRLLDAALGEPAPLPQGLLEPLVALRPGGSLRLGLDGISGPKTMAGSEAGPSTFGHLGFTGTSFWCDPDRGRVTVLLSNRVYPTRQNPRITRVRPKIHDFLWSC